MLRLEHHVSRYLAKIQNRVFRENYLLKSFEIEKTIEVLVLDNGRNAKGPNFVKT